MRILLGTWASPEPAHCFTGSESISRLSTSPSISPALWVYCETSPGGPPEDLGLTVTPIADGEVLLGFEVDARTNTRESVQRRLAGFVSIVNAMVGEGDPAVGQVEMMPAAEGRADSRRPRNCTAARLGRTRSRRVRPHRCRARG